MSRSIRGAGWVAQLVLLPEKAKQGAGEKERAGGVGDCHGRRQWGRREATPFAFSAPPVGPRSG